MFPICELFNIRYPLVQGGMGTISHAALTAAVSNAGGLGTLGCGTLSDDEVASRIKETRTLTEQPFALNIAIRVPPYPEALIDLAIAEKIPVFSLSAGNPAPHIERLKAAGIKTIAVVA
jgi:enoyl-[acyl-carrier protein] reductase II